MEGHNLASAGSSSLDLKFNFKIDRTLMPSRHLVSHRQDRHVAAEQKGCFEGQTGPMVST